MKGIAALSNFMATQSRDKDVANMERNGPPSLLGTAGISTLPNVIPEVDDTPLPALEDLGISLHTIGVTTGSQGAFSEKVMDAIQNECDGQVETGGKECNVASCEIDLGKLDWVDAFVFACITGFLWGCL